MVSRLLVIITALIFAGCTRLPEKAVQAQGKSDPDEIGFAAKPVVQAGPGKTTITFTAAAPTDCAVYILNTEGKVVRHLAAGVLGNNAPAPFTKNSLKQSLTWDRRDDRGNPAGGGPFTIKVCLGLRPALDRFIGHNPSALGRGVPSERSGSVRALATGPTGEVYVFHITAQLHGGEATTLCTVYSREGKYLRTILPYPANLPKDKLGDIKRVKLPNGQTIPFIYQGDLRMLLPGAGNIAPHRAVVTRNGRVAFVGTQEWLRVMLRYAKPGIAQVVMINSDGSIPPGGPRGTLISELSTSKKPSGGYEDRISRTAASLAASPDGKTLYATGFWEGSGRRQPCNHTHVVYSFSWTDKEAKPLIGEKYKPGSGKKLLNTPMSVATDKKGNIYVADRDNNRIAVFKPDGSYLGELKVERPDRVEVHPKTGAVYVLGGPTINLLQKFASWKEQASAVTTTLPCSPPRRRRGEKGPIGTAPVMALDASADPAVLWFTPAARGTSTYSLLRIEDNGKEFGKPVDFGPIFNSRGVSVGAAIDITMDRSRERLYVGWRRVKNYVMSAWDGRTAKRLNNIKFPILRGGTGDISMVGLDGNYYVVNGSKGWTRPIVSRFDPDFKPLPWPEDRNVYAGNAHVHHRGVTADHKGNVYVLRDMRIKGEKRTPTEHSMANKLALFSPDGELLNPKLIDAEIRMLNSVRLDYAGNIYLAVGLRPGKEQVPEDFKGMDLGKKAKVHSNTTELNWYPLMYGCIMKFGPKGGTIRSNIGGDAMSYSMDKTTEVKGARWKYFGASVVASWRMGPPYDMPDTCLCEVPWFDVDGFGRSFFADACRFRCGVLDTAGNLICTFGSYGNQDSAGPGSMVPVPDIPFYWPQAVAVSDEAAYVVDRMNRRVVRVKLTYQVEETCSIQ